MWVCIWNVSQASTSNPDFPDFFYKPEIWAITLVIFLMPIFIKPNSMNTELALVPGLSITHKDIHHRNHWRWPGEGLQTDAVERRGAADGNIGHARGETIERAERPSYPLPQEIDAIYLLLFLWNIFRIINRYNLYAEKARREGGNTWRRTSPTLPSVAPSGGGARTSHPVPGVSLSRGATGGSKCWREAMEDNPGENKKTN